MSWFLLALSGYLCLAVVFVLDKLILEKRIPSAALFTFYSTIFLLAVLLAVPFGVQPLQGLDWLSAIVSGMSFGIGLWAMYKAVILGEASKINPFIGAVTGVTTLFLAFFFLGEVLSFSHQLGVLLLLFATFLLSSFDDKGRLRPVQGIGYALLSGALFALSHTTAKGLYDEYSFLTGFVWSRAAIGLVGLLCLFHKDVWRSFQKRSPAAALKEKVSAALFRKKKFTTVGLVVLDKVLGVLGVVLIQIAIAVGSVSMVNALVGLQYAFMFVLILSLSRFAPRIFKEKMSRFELILEPIAILLILLGSAFFVFL